MCFCGLKFGLVLVLVKLEILNGDVLVRFFGFGLWGFYGGWFLFLNWFLFKLLNCIC